MTRCLLASLAVLLMAGVAASQKPPPVARRKPASEQFRAEALTSFVDAIIADKAGDLDRAVSRYESAHRISPHPNTIYNIADVQRRMEKLADAIESYRKYLELAPGAKDRAEVEKLIEQLATAPGSVVIDGDDPDAVVYVDGKLLGPSPVVMIPTEGKHLAERIGRTTYGHTSFETKPATVQHLKPGSSREATGNVILSGSPSDQTGTWHDNGVTYQLPGRIKLPPGRYETFLFRKDRACTNLVFDVPPGNEVIYVFVSSGKKIQGPGGCYPIKVRQEKVRFAP